MRRVLALAVLVAGCSSSAREPRSTYISVGTDALTSVRAAAAAHGDYADVLEANGEVAVLAVDDGDLEAIAHVMHEEFRRCGGFIVHDSLADAHAALQAPATVAAVDYTIDHAPVVE